MITLRIIIGIQQKIMTFNYMNKEEIIRKYYYDPEVGFSGIDKLYYKLKNQGINRHDIINFLKKQKVYQTNKKVNYKHNSFISKTRISSRFNIH